ncbi:MAG TPA: hypothetical protein VFC31_00130 [Candidatus Limnocylindria bacterium]|nr:hypothetical protein [Candidatus Limnocylindria bacterium]
MRTVVRGTAAPVPMRRPTTRHAVAVDMKGRGLQIERAIRAA